MKSNQATHEMETVSHENDCNPSQHTDVTRRRFLATSAAGVAGLGVVGSMGSAAADTGEHTLEIQGTGGVTTYSFTVGSNLEKSTVDGATKNDSDEIVDRSAHGRVASGKDAYTFDGPLYSFDFDRSNGIDVTLDGEPAHVGRRPDHVIAIEGFGSPTSYSFGVGSQTVEYSDAYGGTSNKEDGILEIVHTGTSFGHGAVGRGVDAYTFDGPLLSFDFDRSNPINVTLDGKAAHVGRRPDRLLTIIATEDYTPYEFNVSGEMRGALHTEDGQDTMTPIGASGAVSGSGFDQYTFDGELTALTYPEGTTPSVFSNHEQVGRTNY